MDYSKAEAAQFVINPAVGNLSLIPERRTYTVTFAGYGYEVLNGLSVRLDGKEIEADASYDEKMSAVTVKLPETEVTQEVRISLRKEAESHDNHVEKRVFEFLNQAEIAFVLKEQIYELIKENRSVSGVIPKLHAMNLDQDLFGAVLEFLTAVH